MCRGFLLLLLLPVQNFFPPSFLKDTSTDSFKASAVSHLSDPTVKGLLAKLEVGNIVRSYNFIWRTGTVLGNCH